MKYPAKSLVWLFAAALMPAQASAQLVGDDSPEMRRPYRGLFGSSSDPQAPQSLMFNGSLYGAWDDDITGGEGSRPSTDPSQRISGYYAGAQASLGYTRTRDAYNMGLNLGAQYRYYPDQSYGAPSYHESFNHRDGPLGARTGEPESGVCVYAELSGEPFPRHRRLRQSRRGRSRSGPGSVSADGLSPCGGRVVFPGDQEPLRFHRGRPLPIRRFHRGRPRTTSGAMRFLSASGIE